MKVPPIGRNWIIVGYAISLVCVAIGTYIYFCYGKGILSEERNSAMLTFGAVLLFVSPAWAILLTSKALHELEISFSELPIGTFTVHARHSLVLVSVRENRPDGILYNLRISKAESRDLPAIFHHHGNGKCTARNEQLE